MMKKISLCICFYNSEKFIKRALDSFVGFLTDEIEVVLVDDGSIDDSVSIVKEYMNKYTQLKLIQHDINKGLSLARKTAVDNSIGGHIMFLDADDEFIKNPFEFFLEDRSYQFYDVIEYGAITDNGERYLNENYEYNKPIDGIEYLNDYFRFKNIYVMLWLRIFRKELFYPKAFSENFRIHEDNMSLPILLSRTNKVIVIDEMLLKINSNPNSITRIKYSLSDKENIYKKLELKASLFYEIVFHLDENVDQRANGIALNRFFIQMALYHSFYSGGDSLRNMLKRQKSINNKIDTRTFLKFKTLIQIKSILNIPLIIFGFKVTSMIIFIISKLNIITNQKLRKVV